ncbi:nucleophile aminohydrolase [Mycena latifolia]|nr:nucleophile aminohydrolase [Mycena latifolia]
MCGLTAVFHPDGVDRPSAKGLESQLEESLEIIKHRGPDSRGIYISPDLRVGLGHLRLSIIDLSTGQQPMSDEDQLIHCVVNGEIYDHERIRGELESEGYSFKSKSDSELVVQLYKRDGINLLFHLRGEFAFVLYDVKRRLLFAARDRFGIKPLNYTVSNGRILFASEIKAFMGLGWKAEWDIDSIVHNGEVGDERTVFKRVHKDETTDESPIAARTANYLGAEIKFVNATESALMGVFEESIWHTEMPNTTFHSAGKILLSKAVRSNGYKVVLSGEGSDEIFGGYPWLLLDYLRRPDPAAAGLGIPLPSDAERLTILTDLERAPGAPQLSSVNVTLDQSTLIKVSAHHVTTILTPFYRPMFHPDVVEVVGAPEIARCIAEGLDPRVRQNSISGAWHSLNVSLYVTVKAFLGRIILNQLGDRADMVNSIESRVAFLDHHLVEYINTLPPSVKIMPIAGDKPGTWSFTEKWILRQAVKPFVTEELYRRKKVPFNPPPRPAGTAGPLPLQLHLKERITQENVEKLGFFNWSYIRDTLADYLEFPGFPAHGAIDHRARILLGVLSFIVLRERFNVPTLKLGL